MILTLTVAVLTVSYLTISFFRSKATLGEVERENALRLCEAGIARGMAELNAAIDYDGNGQGTVGTTTLKDGTFSVSVNTAGLTGLNQRRLVATSRYGRGTNGEGTKRSVEVVIDWPTTEQTASAWGEAAIVAKGDIETNGSITIDGRDYTISNVLKAPGKYGIMGGGAVTISGGSSVGGNGNPPKTPKGEAANSVARNTNWATDGIDNNNDGQIDEAGEGFATGPDQALKLTDGSLKQAAQTAGTFFDNESAYNAYITANGGNIPGGQIIYCDFISSSFNLGGAMSDDPSILIVHNDAGTASVKNLHGDFKGLFWSDAIDHTNGTTNILGMIQAIGQLGNAFGNGSATIHFSSEVLANLPKVVIQQDPNYVVLSWREVMQ